MTEFAPSPEGETPPKPSLKIGDKVQGFEIIGIKEDGTFELDSSAFSYGSVEHIIDAKNARLDSKHEAGDTIPAPPNETEAQAIERTIDDDVGGNKGRGTMKRVKPTTTTSKLQEHTASKDTRKLFKRARHSYWRDRSINGYGEAPSIARSAGIAGKFAKHPELAEGDDKRKLEEAVSAENPQIMVDHIHEKSGSERMTAAEYLEKAKKEQADPGHFERGKNEYPIKVRTARKLAKHEAVDQKKVGRLNRRSEKRANEDTIAQRVLSFGRDSMEKPKVYSPDDDTEVLPLPQEPTPPSSIDYGGRPVSMKKRESIKPKLRNIARKSPVKIRKKNRTPRQS